MKEIEFTINVFGKLEPDDAPLSMVYHYFGKLFNHFSFNEAIQEKIKYRLDFMSKPSLGLAYMLMLRFAAEGFYFGEDELDILNSIVEFISKVNPARNENIRQ